MSDGAFDGTRTSHEDDDLDWDWRHRDHWVRALVRTLVLAAIAYALGGGILATCAWAAIPVTVAEAWFVARNRWGVRWAGALLLFDTLVLATAWFQCVYLQGVFASGSIGGGMDAIAREVAALLRKPIKGDFPLAVPFVYYLQVQALACVLVARDAMQRPTGSTGKTTLALLVVAPAIDWFLLGLIELGPLETLKVLHAGIFLVPLSGIFLGIATGFAYPILKLLFRVTDRASRWATDPGNQPPPRDV